jgi:chromosome segregation protein
LLDFSVCVFCRSCVKCTSKVLSEIYIKGFKTFARPVRMPLEGGVTAIVGPNGSGKSNITDAVLFALGEQSPGVLRAGAMSELIFSGSETLPGAGVAEVTLVFDNGSGEISLPYREVSISRRVSRTGETEYRLNGSRARLSDVRAVAGEAGVGRHSILRQGAVDAIVAGGAAACRLALEEAAGLGVYRRRRLSASRRLEKAGAQLEKCRQLEIELGNQLRRIEAEAAAAREYRELEARYRELSLAHLYRIATQELEGLRQRLSYGGSRVAELRVREGTLRAEEETLGRRLQGLEDELVRFEHLLEALEDGAEDLRTESLRIDRALLRLEAGPGREEERRSVSRLQSELRRLSGMLRSMEERSGELEAEHSHRREESLQLQRRLTFARERAGMAEKERARLAGELETLRVRLARSAPTDRAYSLSEADLATLEDAVARLEVSCSRDHRVSLGTLQERLGEQLKLLEGFAEEVNRRRGALAAATGRAESRIRALQEAAPAGAGTRLYEVIRARPGYETAVEAALGEYGAGVLAENLDEGMKLLSSTERVALRLDAQEITTNGAAPGKPLLEFVEVVDGRYAGAVERLLAGIFVVERPEQSSHVNGYVAVTRDGLRLTRTSVSFRAGWGSFAREARLSAERECLDALKKGPGEILYGGREDLSFASRQLERLTATVHKISAVSERTSRDQTLLVREAGRRRAAAKRSLKELAERERETELLDREVTEVEEALRGAEGAANLAKAELAAASEASDAARLSAAALSQQLTRLHTAIVEGHSRREGISHTLKRARDSSGPRTDPARQIATRAAEASRALAATARERRNALRLLRAKTADAHRSFSANRSTLARRTADLAGELATALAEAERAQEELERAEAAAAAAAEEIQTEWGATLETASQKWRRYPHNADDERHRLARRLKRFGDVNLLALSQEKGLRERHEFVCSQRADAQAATDDLNRIILSVDREIETRFSETFERVRGAFGEMVPRMMAGASGVLDLSEEGVEIGLRLGRKGWRPLRVLSGGERALLALSFLFSIFLSRLGGDSGAFCVLDEAEAALDDLNLARFLAVVDSHRANGQYLLVTHQKRTMAAADVLYGVVQDASGATTVVSKRMQGE